MTVVPVLASIATPQGTDEIDAIGLVHEALDFAADDPDPSVRPRLTRLLGTRSAPSIEDVVECAWNAGLGPAGMRRLHVRR